MSAPRGSVERFVSAVVRAEVARGGTGTDSHAAERIMVRLHRELVTLVGPAGFDVLLARSLVLAQRAHPSLAGITSGPGGTLTGLDSTKHDERAQEEAATAIASHFIELLVTLIGEDLVMHLVGGLWPAANDEERRK